MSGADAERSAALATLLVKAAVTLNDLAGSVFSGRATDDDYLDTDRLLSDLAAVLRDRSMTYVPPRVVDSKKVGQ
ncbi:hypothetical protein [Saccharopolyspora phatthalungensis]|uniref:Uncharacterized protein n=1 Tax=Saccharopolyspora phatthalungensis TaxID=664693 RepID=A0A840Q9F8_9PSEU|nr:hypothetical protein [Saccharopolyspora phatthalungensis]MBB5156371.1 hypothetical protein [Saccharopolyspora phatthalungensis]